MALVNKERQNLCPNSCVLCPRVCAALTIGTITFRLGIVDENRPRHTAYEIKIEIAGGRGFKGIQKVFDSFSKLFG